MSEQIEVNRRCGIIGGRIMGGSQPSISSLREHHYGETKTAPGLLCVELTFKPTRQSPDEPSVTNREEMA